MTSTIIGAESSSHPRVRWQTRLVYVFNKLRRHFTGVDVRSKDAWQASAKEGWEEKGKERRKFNLIADLCRTHNPNKGVILDIGCGVGDLSDRLVSYPYIGVDITGANIEKARQELRPEAGNRHTFEENDAENFLKQARLEGRRFNLIVLNEVVYYIGDYVTFVRGLQDILVPESRIVISVFRGKNDRVWRKIHRKFEHTLVEHRVHRESIHRWDIGVFQPDICR